jgi:hypothetical protein
MARIIRFTFQDNRSRKGAALLLGSTALVATALATTALVATTVAPVAQLAAAQPAGGRATAGQAGATTVSRGQEMVMLLLRRPCPERARVTAGVACPAQRPVLSLLAKAHAEVISTTTLLDTVTARVSAQLATKLSRDHLVAKVVPDTPARGTGQASSAASTPAAQPSSGGLVAHGVAPASLICGTRAHPEVAPQALQVIRAHQAFKMGIDGAGVTVAILSDGINPTDEDFLRNSAYGPNGQRVIRGYQDFSGDGVAAKTDGAEAFGDASSIAAQGNKLYNLAQYANPDMASVLPKGGCWIKVVGAAPGSSLLVLKVIGQSSGATASSVVQALQYAVQHGAKVVNESLGSEPFPDTSLDVFRQADDAAVAAGVTVVVSTGDAGPTSTIGSPASDPNVISVGATTTFKAYAQSNLGGFYNPAVGNGHWVSGNVSSLSSGGFSQAGATLDLVAPGDANWSVCSTNYKFYTGCKDIFGGKDIGVENFGGTSEAAPLVAAAAADVIEAYAKAHGGTDPSPALVKLTLCSTATDIGAPADEQGCGLLNIEGAVRLAESLPAEVTPPTTTTTVAPTTTTVAPTTTTVPAPTTTALASPAAATSRRVAASSARAAASSARAAATRASQGGPDLVGAEAPAPPAGTLLVSPSQLNVSGQGRQLTPEQLSFTNTGKAPTVVHLATRELGKKVYDTGTREFVMNPASLKANSGVMPIWSGVREVYQVEHFMLPPSSGTRLVFSADYPNTHQSSVLHVALFEPDGAYAGYSNPQGLGDFAEAEVAEPPAGEWTALFFTELNGAITGQTGTKGLVQWDASLWSFTPGATVSPAVLSIAPGQTRAATVLVRNPLFPGDYDQSVVVSEPSGRTTVPITIRTYVPMGRQGGTFKGVLTGGNGRSGSQAQTNTYFFNVPPGEANIDVSIALKTDPGEPLVGYLVGPLGETVGYSSNYTVVPKSATKLGPGSTRFLQMYNVAPEPGQWELVLQWVNPVTGNELSEPFSGAIRFDRVDVKSLLPATGATVVPQGQARLYPVAVTNTGVAPEAVFLDPRLDETTTVPLKNVSPGTSAVALHLPRKPNQQFPIGVPIYLVPTGTTELVATVSRLSGQGSVSFDLSRIQGDPDVSPLVPAPGVSASGTRTSETLTFTSPEVSPGLWALQPGEVGPYPAAGAPKEVVNVKVSAVTQAFNPDITTHVDDLWEVGFKFSKFYYLEPGQSVIIPVQVKPTAPIGTHVTGTLYVDDFTLEAFVGTEPVLPDADELAALPYSYTVGAP